MDQTAFANLQPGDVILKGNSHSVQDQWLGMWESASLVGGSDPNTFWWEFRGCTSRLLSLVPGSLGVLVPDVCFAEFCRAFNTSHFPFIASKQSSWNSRGLLSSDPNIYQRKADRGRKLCSKHDIALFQEVHGNRAAAEVFLDGVDSHAGHFSSNRAMPNKGGLLTCVGFAFLAEITKKLQDQTSLSDLYDNPDVEDYIAGRVHFVTYSWNCGWKLRIINVHFDPDWRVEKQIQVLKHIRTRILNPLDGLTIVGGDWNFVTAENDKVDLLQPHVCYSLCTAGEFWNNNFEDLLEHFQPSLTRADTTDHPHPTAGRLDRIYSTHDRMSLTRCKHYVTL